MTEKHEEVFLVTKTVNEVWYYWSSRMVKYQPRWYNATFYQRRETAERCAEPLGGVVMKYSLLIDSTQQNTQE